MKNLLLTFIVLLSCYYAIPTTAQVVFGGEQVVSAYNQQTTQMADMNNDGRQDLVSFSQSNQQIICYLNQGTSYWDNIYFLVNQQEFSEKVILADINQDSRIDIICQQKRGLFWYRNIGNMHFADLQMLCANCVTMNNYWTVEDMNNDSQMDILSYDTTAVHIRYQESSLIFNEPINVPFETTQSNITNKLQLYNISGGWPKELIVKVGNYFKVFKQVGSIYQSMSFSLLADNILSLTFGHLNNDGQIDVVIHKQTAPMLQACFNYSSGFECTTLLENQVIYNIAITDINGDSQQDVVVITSAIKSFINNGNSELEEHYYNMLLNDVLSPSYIADVNDDGYQDIINVYNHEISVLINENNGAYERLAVQPQLEGSHAASSKADFDNDGNQDVLAVVYPYLFIYHYNEQDKIRYVQGLHIALPSSTSYKSHTVGDIDRDGDVDIVIGYGNTFQLIRNEGNGVFIFSSHIADCLSCDNVVITDLNQDTYPDIVYTENEIDLNRGKVKAAFREWDDDFSPPFTLLNSSSQIINSFHIVNFQGNQSSDIIATNYTQLFWAHGFESNNYLNTYSWTVLQGAAIKNSKAIQLPPDEDNTFLVATTNGLELFRLVSPDSLYRQTIWETNDIYRIHLLDIDQNGLQDILIQLQTAVNFGTMLPMVCLYNLGMGNFSEPIRTSINTGTNITAMMRMNKGFIINALSKMSYYELFNAPIFADHLIDQNAEEAQELSPADIDQDGWIDIVATTKGDNTIAWYRNLQNKTFAPKQIINNEAMGVTALQVTDMDNDNDPDIVATATDANQILYHINNGQGNFSNPIIVGEVPNVSAIGVGDVDRNGLADIITFSPANGQLYWYRPLDNNVFETILIQTDSTTAIALPKEIVLRDVDADGFADIVVCSTLENKINYLRYVGSDTFSTFHRITTDFPQAICVGNYLGNDFLEEILIASTGNMMSTGNLYSSFTSEIITDEQGIKSIILTDLNNDGYEDIVYAMDIEDKINWSAGNRKGIFSQAITITNDIVGVTELCSADLDNDGDQDIVSADLL
ncbi:MAG TPA: VCBS repeat-containing protein, partial [Chitinophagales bacterium]|nr:VCBS repeat-containing protein [Chitinophagales bacterium]